jgi:hypothetical protein
VTRPLFNTITDADWRDGIQAARRRRNTSTTRILMQAFLSRASELMPGVAFTVLADVGAGLVDVTTIPADRIPQFVTVRAEWRHQDGQQRRADFDMTANALQTNPRLFAGSVTDRLAPIVKGGAS